MAVTAGNRRRSDPRAAATRMALVEAAEGLFATRGIDGVSLREIAAAIDAGNTNVVAYHFGGKDALVTAIFELRLAAIDARRAALMAAADDAGGGDDLITLLDAMWRPLLEQTDAVGRHSYAGFLDAVFRSDRLPLRAALTAFEATNQLAARIAAAIGRDLDEAFRTRLQICLTMAVATLRLIDQGHDGGDAVRLFTETTQMMAAALRAAQPERARSNS